MATLNAVTVVPNPIPAGQAATVTVTFNLDAGAVFDVVVTENGVEKFRGQASETAETTPTVSVGQTGTGWEIRTVGGGTLTALGGNQFNLVA